MSMECAAGYDLEKETMKTTGAETGQVRYNRTMHPLGSGRALPVARLLGPSLQPIENACA